MRWAVLGIGIAVGALVVSVLAVDYWLLDEGEVATLMTYATNGDLFETQVWVVDGQELPGGEDDVLYLRAHSGETEWLARLHEMPQVELTRNGWTRPYWGETSDDAALRKNLNHAMAVKYGLADRLVALIADPKRSVPVRLEPDPIRAGRDLGPGGEHP